MITFAELESLVVNQTRRPEIPDITKAALRTAVLRAHHTDFFPRDKSQGSLLYTPSSTALFYSFENLSSSLPNLRSLYFLQGLDAANFSPVETLEYRDVDDLYDSDGVRRPSTYTLLGDTLRVYPVQATGNLAAYYFKNPTVAELSFSSWIADLYPDAVAMWAAGIVFARAGFAEQAQQVSEQHVKPFKELLVASHLLGTVS